MAVRQLRGTSQGTFRVSYSQNQSEQLEHAHLNWSTTGVMFLVLLHHRRAAGPREMTKVNVVTPHLPGMDAVPGVVKRVAHYVCVRIMQLSEHLKRECSLINIFCFLVLSAL